MWRLEFPRGSPPRGRRCLAPNEAGEALAGDCARQSRAPDHWRALECRSQKPGERRWGRKGHPRQATDCGSEQGELSREGCLLSGAVERS